MAAGPGADAVPAPRNPEKLALLLPLSGSQRAAAETIRDGFLSAYFGATGTARPEVLIFDEERPGPAEAFAAAAAAGAMVVVGPLLKDAVGSVARMPRAVTTLALNNTEAAPSAGAAFFQFSLAPEDEAVQVAERATGIRQNRFVALLPDSDLGRRLLAAFGQALKSRGGELVAQRFYDPAGTNFSGDIRRLLLLDLSESRHRALSAFLGQPLEFEPARRPDADGIFLVASPAAGRLIRPQLRFFYAGDLPTYATSAIYLPGGGGEDDLEGVMFPDAPLLVSPDSVGTALRATLESRWPAAGLQRARLDALGFDAFTLARNLSQGVTAEVAGQSGTLYVDQDRRVHRRLTWARFRDGHVVALPHTGAAGPDTPAAP